MAAPVVASVPKAICTVPLECDVVYVATAAPWHSAQATGLERLPFTCTWCAPTPCAVVALLPFVSIGGAAFTLASAPATATRLALPWQLVQVSATTSSVPLMCVVRFTDVLV